MPTARAVKSSKRATNSRHLWICAVFITSFIVLSHCHWGSAWDRLPFVASCKNAPSRSQGKLAGPVSRPALGGSSRGPDQPEDWRDFRARLVQQELEIRGDSDRSQNQSGWAYQTDLLEQGSLLLSVPGDYWALRRQYFCKVVMLVISHDDKGSVAVVLNRPTAFTTADFDLGESDLPTDQMLKLVGLSKGSEEWKVWFGGDCEALECPEGAPPKHFCLHTLEKFADKSTRVIKGVFVISLVQARFLVACGQARKEDFMVLVGYTGWAPRQLQGELDRGGAWILGAADRGLLLGLNGQGDTDLALTERLEAACVRHGAAAETAAGAGRVEEVGDGVYHWQQLYQALRPNAMESLRTDEEAHNDEMVRRWVDIYIGTQATKSKRTSTPPKEVLSEAPTLPYGTVLCGSATHWLLGRPAGTWPSRLRPDPWMLPGQYLHKAVMLLAEESSANRPSTLVLLNGPKIGETREEGCEVLFGGPGRAADSRSILPLPGGGAALGKFRFPAGLLQELLESGAIWIAKGVDLQELLRAERSQRWAAAGGTLSTVMELAAAVQGDEQQKRWYRAHLGTAIDAKE